MKAEDELAQVRRDFEAFKVKARDNQAVDSREILALQNHNRDKQKIIDGLHDEVGKKITDASKAHEEASRY